MKTITTITFLLAMASGFVSAAPSAAPVPAPPPTSPASNAALIEARSIFVYRPIKSAANTNLCLEAVNGNVVLNPCANTATQFWGPFRNSDNIYRWQNRGTVDCMWVDDASTNNAPVHTGGCTLSDGSGRSVSNSEWDIGTNIPPSVISTMRTHVGGSTRNLCLTAVGNTVAMRTCPSSPGNDQRWLIGAD
ncbi:hypothetical protein B0H63DRAFT_535719 [Podospora didyma]|uniref:Ricin B lectin domain-containing protein n=1 Tax=Podospora didyma TaxID=330526 RepID=A0AAE0K0Z1_9PEZI|nr:hypothetical protein B0H63DRAFT_535719 [Podospora didyma]